MVESGLLQVGIGLLITGVVFLVIIFAVIRIIPKMHPNISKNNEITIPTDLPKHHDAVLIVRGGGLVTYINDESLRLFGLTDEYPNLELMSKKTRPVDTFLGLCAAEGNGRFSVNGQWVDGSSYQYPENNHQNIFVSLRPIDVTSMDKEENDFVNNNINILSELTKSIPTDRGLEAALRAILESIEQIILSDYTLITIWDRENEILIPYQLKEMRF